MTNYVGMYVREFFYGVLLADFCLLVYHVNKFNAFVVMAFVYNLHVKQCKSKTPFPFS